ncbi:MAG: DUF1467 family protein [Pseudomonadota bacterium]
MEAWSIVGAVVSFAVIWWLVLLVILPIGVPSQADLGSVEPGTPQSAPARMPVKRKLLYATLITIVPWAIFNGFAWFEVVTLEDMDFLFPESFKEPPAHRPEAQG